MQVHGGTEQEGWAALEAARDVQRTVLAEKLRKRIAAGRLGPLSEEEIQERAAAAYKNIVMERVRWQAGLTLGVTAVTLVESHTVTETFCQAMSKSTSPCSL
jgi:methionine synthase I (cobalamin-dependent)